jgi:thiamine biosynthesis lipoprotein
VTTEQWRDWSCAVAVTVTDDRDLEVAVPAVRTVMAEVGLAASRFRDDSDLARINAQAGRWVPVGPLTLELVETAVAVARRTGGAVTPTVGAALVALGYDADIETVTARPAAPQAPPGLPAPAADEAVRVDRVLGRIGVAPGTRLDLGALAKAHAVDESVRRIDGRARGGVLVSIGGDLAVHRAPADGWTISVSERADGPAEAVVIDGGALATSSTTGRRWGADRHHVVDPRTGRCAAGPWRTATVWAPSALEANVLSTWLLVDAPAAERALARDARPARLVASDGAVRRRHGWPAGAALATPATAGATPC